MAKEQVKTKPAQPPEPPHMILNGNAFMVEVDKIKGKAWYTPTKLVIENGVVAFKVRLHEPTNYLALAYEHLAADVQTHYERIQCGKEDA